MANNGYNPYPPFPLPSPYAHSHEVLVVPLANPKPSHCSINMGGDKKVSSVQQKPVYQDVWAAILWLLCLFSLVIISAVYAPVFQLASENLQLRFDPQRFGFLAVLVVGLSIGLSIGYLSLMERFAAELIKATFVSSIVLQFFWICYLFYIEASILFIAVFALVCVFYAYYLWSWRSRIPFAAVLLTTVSSVTKRFYGTVVLSIIISGLQTALYFWVLFVMVGLMIQDGDGSQNNFLYFYLVFCFYWNVQVFKNVLHVTTAGVVGSFYFFSTDISSPNLQNVTLASAKRALTTSFGSVCFGSLFISLIRTSRACLQMGVRRQRRSGFTDFIATCSSCILGFIESLVEYFNHYAFTEVALYGKDFCTSAKDTWRLLKDRGVDAVINDNLIGNVLGLGIFVNGIVCGLLCYLYSCIFPFFDLEPYFTGQMLEDFNILYTFLAVMICALVGMTVSLIIAEVIESGVTTTFVCLAEDPLALQRTKPSLYNAVLETYPQLAPRSV